MNEKLSRKLRKIAKIKATSWKNPTTQGVKSYRNYHLSVPSGKTLNIQDGISYQYCLDKFSVGAITRKLKKLWNATPSPMKSAAYRTLSYLMEKEPERLGLSV